MLKRTAAVCLVSFMAAVLSPAAQQPELSVNWLELPPLRGRVVDNNLQPLPGVAMRLVDSSGAVRETRTGDEGEYSFECLFDGPYSLEFSLQGFLTSSVRFEYNSPARLEINQLLTVNVSLPYTPRLVLRVRDSSEGFGLAGVRVQVGQYRLETDACGLLSDSIPPGSYPMRLEKEGYRSVLERIEIKRDARLALDRETLRK